MNGTVGSLFSGCLGLDLGLEAAGLDVRWACEADRHCQELIGRRRPGLLVVPDVRELDAGVEPVDVLAGGFPCQDVSYAGRRAGLSDGTRSGLWGEFARAVRVLRPRVVVVENVPGLLTAGFGVVMADLAEAGYDARWACFRAADVGAPHGRERIFVVATDADDATGNRQRPRPESQPGGEAATDAAREPGESGGRRRAQGGDHAWAVEAQRDGDRLDGPAEPRQAVPAAADPDGGRREQRDEAVGRVSVAREDGAPPATDAGGDGLVRFAPVDGPHLGVGVEPRHDADRRDLGDAGPHGGHAREVAADPGREGRERAGSAVEAGAAVASERVEWGAYEPAVRRWESILGRAAPRPTDDRGRLMPEFVEWMMGFPDGWTEGASRTQRLKMLGNAVQVQVGEVVGVAVAELLAR